MNNAIYRHIVLEGTSHECGYQLGAHIRNRGGAEYALYTQLKPGQRDLSTEELYEFLQRNDQFFPGINDEIRGLADGLAIPLERLTACMMWFVRAGGCSQLAALPGGTADGHVLAARSYEWSREDALCLITTRAIGKFAHIGFSIFGCGRFDGINEKGLCVTMSAAKPGIQQGAGGFMFWAGMRAALDCCATVEEALALILPLPSCSCDIIILSDRQGNAALVENDLGFRAVKRFGAESRERYLYAANHYTLPEMAGHGNGTMWMSSAREKSLERFFQAEAPRVTAESLKALLGAPVPDGLCCHYYREWFGTLWSIVFDVTEGIAEVCFGSPAVNPWRRFGLNGAVGVKEYPACLPDETCTDPNFFSRINQ